jgi:hypothetical protein
MKVESETLSFQIETIDDAALKSIAILSIDSPCFVGAATTARSEGQEQ